MARPRPGLSPRGAHDRHNPPARRRARDSRHSDSNTRDPVHMLSCARAHAVPPCARRTATSTRIKGIAQTYLVSSRTRHVWHATQRRRQTRARSWLDSTLGWSTHSRGHEAAKRLCALWLAICMHLLGRVANLRPLLSAERLAGVQRGPHSLLVHGRRRLRRLT